MSTQPPAQPPATGGAPPASNTTTNSTAPSYAMVTKSICTSPTLAPVPLAHRPLSYVDNIPAIILTSIEEDQLRKQRENTLIMKFSVGMPNLYEIRSHIYSEWNLEQTPAVGVMDQRHVTLHMASPTDTKRALAHTKNKIKTSMFRLFRWTPEFEIGRDSALVAVWVKMFNLPLHYFNESSLIRLGSILGNVLRVHPSTMNLTQQRYAKVCVELDVSKSLLEKLWIGTSKEYGWEISLEYEGNHAYCEYCGLLGHTLGLCRKKRDDHGKAVVKDNRERPENNTHRSGKNGRSEQWVMKNKVADPGGEQNLQNNDGQITERTTPQAENLILRNKEHGIGEETRQKLIETGLASHSGHQIECEGNQFETHSSMVQSKQRLSPDAPKSTQSVDTVGSKGGNSSKLLTQRDPVATKTDQVVQEIVGPHVVTPVRNKFSVLQTEEELHDAFENLQRSKDSTPKVAPESGAEKLMATATMEDYMSDGAGTKDKSNMGIQFQSAPNSEGEGDELEIVGVRTRTNKKIGGVMRRSTRVIKSKAGLDFIHY